MHLTDSMILNKLSSKKYKRMRLTTRLYSSSLAKVTVRTQLIKAFQCYLVFLALVMEYQLIRQLSHVWLSACIALFEPLTVSDNNNDIIDNNNDIIDSF